MYLEKHREEKNYDALCECLDRYLNDERSRETHLIKRMLQQKSHLLLRHLRLVMLLVPTVVLLVKSDATSFTTRENAEMEIIVPLITPSKNLVRQAEVKAKAKMINLKVKAKVNTVPVVVRRQGSLQGLLVQQIQNVVHHLLAKSPSQLAING